MNGHELIEYIRENNLGMVEILVAVPFRAEHVGYEPVTGVDHAGILRHDY